MLGIIAVTIVTLLGYLFYQSWKSSRLISSSNDFLDFGSRVDVSTLRRTFEGTNASFATAALALFLYSASLGMYVYAILLGLFLSIILYVYVLLPKKMRYLAQGVRYPQLIEQATGKRFIRVFVGFGVLLSLWMFAFAEIQAFQLFLVTLFQSRQTEEQNWLSQLIPVLVVFTIGSYVMLGGYRSVVMTDRIQTSIIYVGTISIICVSLYLLSQLDGEELIRLFNTSSPLFTSAGDGFIFVCETLVGLMFGQILYYDNWQRLSLYVQHEINKNSKQTGALPSKSFLITLQKRIARSYLLGMAVLFFIYLSPILIAQLLMAQGQAELNMNLVAQKLIELWEGFYIIGPLLVLSIILHFLASLMSTADTYIISAAQVVYEDIMRQRKRKHALLILRGIVIGIALSILLMIYAEPDFESFIFYLYYSANGLVGPLLFALFGKKLNPWAVSASILFGIAYPLIPLFPSISDYVIYYPGIVPVLFSIGILWAWPSAVPQVEPSVERGQ